MFDYFLILLLRLKKRFLCFFVNVFFLLYWGKYVLGYNVLGKKEKNLVIILNLLFLLCKRIIELILYINIYYI